MFVDAIERVDAFTRPLHSIIRLYGHNEVIPGTATLFFVNEDGCAITCKHVAELLTTAETIHKEFRRFQGARRTIERDANATYRISQLEAEYKLAPNTSIRMLNSFINCFDEYKSWSVVNHPTQDLALLRFEGYNRKLYRSYATFLGDSSQIKMGRSLCRLGYPFPDFNNFRYNPSADDIEWTTTGRITSPPFPIDGIVTRLLKGKDGLTSIEMSTPGLRGQSGGPLFDTKGRVYGMQSATRHLHLGFDIENEIVLINGRRSRVSNYPFLNVGDCVHVDVIKSFLREQDVKFYEE